MNLTEKLKDRLLGQIATTKLCRAKLLMATNVKRDVKYWKDEVLKSECISDGLRIAIELCEKEEKKAA